MEPIFSSIQMRDIDSIAIKEYGIKGLVLMENAARFSYEKVKNLIKERAIIICGSGNNAGDGYALARQLYTRGIDVMIYKKSLPQSKNAKTNYSICKKIKIPMYSYEKLLNLDPRETLIVDAIFGTGLNKEIKGVYNDVINWINEHRNNNTILSLDIPSGLDANSGKILGICVKSHIVTTFGGYKRGFFQNTGADYYKKVFVDNITTPKKLLNSNINTFAFPSLKKRMLGFNKYDLGKVGIIAGSKDYEGAPVISSLGLLKSGAGMLYVITPKDIAVKRFPPEIIGVKFSQKAGYFSPELGKKEIEFLQTLDVIILGPGMGKTKAVEEFINKVLENYSGKIVIDADAIAPAFNFIQNNNQKFEYVITPHSGEFKSIFPEGNSDIFENIDKFSNKFGMPALIKGSFAYFSDGLGNIHVQPHASSYMSKGGTGDGLAGLLGGFWAQGYSLYEAINISTYLISRTSEILEEQNEITSIHITKILENLDLAIKEL